MADNLNDFILVSGLPRKAGGTGSGQGGPVTRSGTRDPRPRADSHGPSRARNLEELQQAVERGAGRWAEKGQLPTFVKAFSKATKVLGWARVLHDSECFRRLAGRRARRKAGLASARHTGAQHGPAKRCFHTLCRRLTSQ